MPVNQTGVQFGAVLLAFLIFITLKGHLRGYLQVLGVR